MGNQKLDVFLYGSCVSRDLQEQSRHRFYRRAYVARQSLISAMNPAYVYDGGHRLDSAWQHRMVQGDLASNLLTRLSEDAPRTDLVIWDLTDERMGVQPLGDGSFGTITPDSLRSGILEAFEEHGGPIRFGTRRHLMLWEEALRRFAAVLDALGLRARTYVLAPQWAAHDVDGKPVEVEGNRSASEWGRAYAPYMRRIEAAGIAVVELPEELVVTHGAHKWGAAPYHYIDESYRYWAEEIDRRAGTSGKRRTHPAPPEPGDAGGPDGKDDPVGSGTVPSGSSEAATSE